MAESKLIQIPHTVFAGPYQSNFLQIHSHLEDLLSHVNCSHFSTRGQAPTLLELKQHTQSLLVLIKHLTIATTATPVDDHTSAVALAVAEAHKLAEIRNAENAHQREVDISTGKKTAESPPDPLEVACIRAIAFDFLADLTKPYQNSDPTHQIALTGLLNGLEDRGALDRGGRDHCPLHEAAVTEDFASRGSHALPYAETWKLIKHADELLERLDHEFGAEGGLLGMLPIGEDGNDLSQATNLLGKRSILGQWIAFTRGLVVRLHEYELNLTECLDIVAGEAVVPKMMLSQVPVNQQQAMGVAHTENFIISLAAGKHDELRAQFKAKEDEAFDANKHALGSGEGNQDLLTLDVVTRYSRLRDGSTIFIAPGDIQASALRPGVVQVVKGEWRDRSSLWEVRHKTELERLRRIVDGDYVRVKSEAESRKLTVAALEQERNAYLLAGGKLPVTETEKQVLKDLLFGPEISAARESVAAERAELCKQREALDADVAKHRKDSAASAKRLQQESGGLGKSAGLTSL